MPSEKAVSLPTENAAKIVVYRYNRKIILRHTIIFQGVLLILIWWTLGLSMGLIRSRSEVMTLVILGGGYSLYVFCMAMLMRMLHGPEYLSIASNGELRLTPLFSTSTAILPCGSRVVYDDSKVQILSSLRKIGSEKSRGGMITIRFMTALCPVGKGEAVIR